MLTVNKFVHLYHLKESREFRYYEFVPWDRKSRLVADLPSSFRYWKSIYFFMSGDGWETLPDDFWGDVPTLLRRWETPLLGAFALQEMLPFPSTFFFFFNPGHYSDPCVLPFTVKERPDLESKFNERVQAAVKYAGPDDQGF